MSLMVSLDLKLKNLERLIDSEVSKVFSNLVSKEPETEKEVEKDEVINQNIRTQANLSEEELDVILFYGGNKPENNN